MPLMVKCKSCKMPFASPIEMGEEAFKTSVLMDNTYQCDACGAMNTYDKADHFFV